ncbi:MAG TPA: ABC transporter permease subunit [Oligoflexia bacterium]|nr:ABC transporter permease subunit [Oligoflexia bacterium]
MIYIIGMFRQPSRKSENRWSDLLVLGSVAALIYAGVTLAARWTGEGQMAVEIDLHPSALPKYALFSFSRAAIAYALSLAFSLVYGYCAAKARRAERVMIPLLDILQSIPVLGFLPGLVIGLMAVFPKSNVGLELACILMIFSGQAWNMTYSFYSSVKAVPQDLSEACGVMRLSWMERLKRLELPFAAIGLAWNSLMSMAGGWFFLTVCESFPLGERKFQLPGVGSYMAVAIEQGDHRAMVFGIGAMVGIILFVDFLIWRPVMVWVRKFRMEEVHDEVASLPFVTVLLRDSVLIRKLKPFWSRKHPARAGRRRRRIAGAVGLKAARQSTAPLMPIPVDSGGSETYRESSRVGWKILSELATPLFALGCLWAAIQLWELVRELTLRDWRLIFSSTLLTAARVGVAVLLGSLWTIPFGILVGSSPKLLRFFQPIVQVVASFPAPMLYPLALMIMFKAGITLHWGSAILMMLGVQWYILFNVLAGGMKITNELRDGLTILSASKKVLWKRLYLPAVFPTLVVGWFNAAGGAWNASIVAEHIHYDGRLNAVPGIGSMISRAAAAGNFPLLAGSLLVMVGAVLLINNTLWRWLSDLAETRFRMDR